MSIKGFPSQQKRIMGQSARADFVTVQPTFDYKNAADVHARFAFRVGSPTVARTAQAGTGNVDGYGTYIADTATPAMVGDFVRFADGNMAYLEVTIVDVDTNGFRLAARVETAREPAAGDTFFIMRYATQLVDDTGAQLVIATPGPTQFVLDGADVEVEEDTTDPTNNILFPVKVLGSYIDSVRWDYAVDGTVDNASWTQLVADTGAEVINSITLFDGGGYAMELGIGAAASEVRTLLIPPGGFNGVIPFWIPANSRISLRAVGAASVSVGEIDINFMR